MDSGNKHLTLDLLGIIPDAVLAVDREGVIMHANVHADKLFGYQLGGLVGLRLELLLPERFRSQHAGLVSQFFADPVGRPMGSGRELFAVRKSGEEFPVEVAIGPLSERDLSIAVIRDITEIVRTRSELAHIQRITTISGLTGALSHEISQPLTAIRANTQAALRFLDRESPDLEEIREILIDVANDDRRASDVLQNVRNLLKKAEPATESLDINAVVGQSLALLRSEAVMERIQVTLELAEGLPSIRGNRVQLQQVMVNLLLNAFEAMVELSGQKRVVLATSLEDRTDVRVSVVDSGPGLGGQTSEYLFAPFKTNKPNGMGLGLSISRSIVDNHGGRIWGEDNPGGGAVFHISLPVDSEFRPNLD